MVLLYIFCVTLLLLFFSPFHTFFPFLFFCLFKLFFTSLFIIPPFFITPFFKLKTPLFPFAFDFGFSLSQTVYFKLFLWTLLLFFFSFFFVPFFFFFCFFFYNYFVCMLSSSVFCLFITLFWMSLSFICAATDCDLFSVSHSVCILFVLYLQSSLECYLEVVIFTQSLYHYNIIEYIH